jgi:hypothetical protein
LDERGLAELDAALDGLAGLDAVAGGEQVEQQAAITEYSVQSCSAALTASPATP